MKTKIITRSEYMAGKASHDDYYSQFVTSSVKSVVANFIGEDAIKKSTCPHFNDIALLIWDKISLNIGHECAAMVQRAGDTYALATGVCIAKQAARMIKATA